MKNFDLNALGVTELTQKSLIEVNGGESPFPDPWTGLIITITQMVYYFYKDIIPVMVSDYCERASQDGHIPYADLGHR
jgi:hypothetical protein